MGTVPFGAASFWLQKGSSLELIPCKRVEQWQIDSDGKRDKEMLCFIFPFFPPASEAQISSTVSSSETRSLEA